MADLDAPADGWVTIRHEGDRITRFKVEAQDTIGIEYDSGEDDAE